MHSEVEILGLQDHQVSYLLKLLQYAYFMHHYAEVVL